MPLLCSLLSLLLLLPLSLSCDSQYPPQQVKSEYMAIVRIDLNRTKENLTKSLQNSSCPAHKQQYNCSGNVEQVVSTLEALSCRMKELRLPNVRTLADNVLPSKHCECLGLPTKTPRRRRRTTRRQRRNKRTMGKKTRKLCKAQALLRDLAECYAIFIIKLDT